MSLYSYPVGATLGGHVLTERTVQPARAVTIGDVQHGPEIFLYWTLPELNAIGILAWEEDSVPQDYAPGEPVDVEEGGTIRRTYPDAKPEPVAIAAQARAEIMSELAALDVYVPRSVEEIYAANPQCGLSDINQGRVARKIELRTQLQALAE